MAGTIAPTISQNLLGKTEDESTRPYHEIYLPEPHCTPANKSSKSTCLVDITINKTKTPESVTLQKLPCQLPQGPAREQKEPVLPAGEIQQMSDFRAVLLQPL